MIIGASVTYHGGDRWLARVSMGHGGFNECMVDSFDRGWAYVCQWVEHEKATDVMRQSIIQGRNKI